MSDKHEEHKDKKPITDIAEPGKSVPSGTSKPVLVSNRPILKDPMVVDDGKDDNDNEKGGRPELKRSSQPTVQPPKRAESDKPDSQPESSKDEAAADEPKPPEEHPVPAGQTDDVPEKPTETAGEPSSGTLAADEAKPGFDVSSQDQGKPKTDAEKKLQAEEAERAKHDAMIQQLVEGGQYVLPIHSPQQQKTKNFIILGVFLAIVLILAWLDIALDAHIISLGSIHPLTHIFSN